jgi:FkbM family methyltransferase
MIAAFRNIHRLLTRHPLTEKHPVKAYGRFLRWQFASRLIGAGVIVPFVDNTQIAVNTGMAGATGNIYVGLMEFVDMSFVLHFLTDDDLFGDVGANVGVYSILASGVRRAHTVAIEPVPSTVASLRRNVAVNDLGDLVEVRSIGVGAEKGTLRFSSEQDAMNHVITTDEGINVSVLPLDDVFDKRIPNLLKIDVEGFESMVLKGGARVLGDTGLKAIIIELNASGRRYGFDDRAIDAQLRDLGFKSFAYNPWTRALSPAASTGSQNTIYIRDLEFVERRLKAAKPFRVLQYLI